MYLKNEEKQKKLIKFLLSNSQTAKQHKRVEQQEEGKTRG